MAWNGLYGAPSYQGSGAQKKEGKRERHTFDAAELAHVWAHEGTSWGNRSDRRMFFEADSADISKHVQRVSTIYSYGHHFPIASLYHVKGRPIVLFTTRDYSTSTGKHKSEVRRAISHLPTYYIERPNVLDSGENDYKQRLARALERATNPRVRNIRDALNTIRETIESGNAFAKLFGFKWRLNVQAKKLAALEARATELDARRAELDATATARRVVRNAAKLTASIREWRDHPQLLQPRAITSGGRTWNERHAFLDYAQSPDWTTDDAAELTRRAANRIAIWRDYGGQAYDLPGTLLRVADGAYCTLARELVGNIETSQGASFPLEHGVKALPLIRRLAEREAISTETESWMKQNPEIRELLYKRNGHTIHLGHYAIDRIERRADGVHVIAGCHDVPLREVEECAARLGL